MKKMINRARNLISAQKEAQAAQDKYMRAELYKDLLKRTGEEYAKSAENAKPEDITAEAVKAYLVGEKTAVPTGSFP
jgi:hypothetical protein